MVYKFSWDRYTEDLDKAKLLISLETELQRLKSVNHPNVNTLIGITHMQGFVDGIVR